MKRKIIKSIVLSGLLVASMNASDINVKITNNAGPLIHFTPLLISVHPSTSTLFTLGSTSSSALKAMAEGGDISGLTTQLTTAGGTNSNKPTTPHSNGHLLGGESADANLTTTATNTHLSIAGMILPTNDGFVALNNWEVPTTAGTYKINLIAYDSGTEANTELTADVPGGGTIATGTGASGVATTAEGFVHVHRGVIGDNNATGGHSDLDINTHRWLNPIATAVITVK